PAGLHRSFQGIGSRVRVDARLGHDVEICMPLCRAIAFGTFVIVGLSLLAAPLLASDATTSDVDILWAVKIPLRDGVRLNATVVKPRPQGEPLPVVFTLTPYVADTYYARAQYFARRGYVFALVDVRGRGNSEGTFVPFENEAEDGHDVVEWL